MPDTPDRVSVKASARPGLRKAGESGTFVLVKPEGMSGLPSADDVEVVRASVTVANDAVPPRTVIGDFTTATQRGIAIATFWNGSIQDTSHDWLSALAHELMNRGYQGTIGHIGKWSLGLDPMIYANDGRRFPAAFVGYRVDHYTPRNQPLSGWQVAPSTTQRISDRLQSRTSSTANDVWVGTPYGSIPISNSEVSAFFSSTAALTPSFKLLYRLSPDRTICHQTVLSQFGEFVSQTMHPTLDWRALLEAQIELLLLDPQAADVGLIKNAWLMPLDWSALDMRGENAHTTVRLPLDYESNRHLWDEYVIDAAGVNLLTDKHLTHAHDLTDWDVTEVAPKRYLVKAKNLADWYGADTIEPATITNARRDFGDMILTWDTILANPGPYTVTDPLIVGR